MRGEAQGWVERRPGSAPGARLWVRADWEERLRAAGLDRPDCRLRERPASEPGRGSVAVIRLPGTPDAEVVLKRYRRGGLAARLLPDLFLGWGRSRREFRIAEAARRCGLPVPEPLALIREGRCGLFRLYGVTRRIPDARNLLVAIDAGAPAPRGREWLAGVARTVRRAHDLGLVHPDLHLGNLLGSGGAGRVSVHIVDLAGARMGDPLSPGRRWQGLARLRRSWEKACFRSGVPPGSEVTRFLSWYCGGDRTLRRTLRRGRLRLRLLLRAHRIGWGRGSRAARSGVTAAAGRRPIGDPETGTPPPGPPPPR